MEPRNRPCLVVICDCGSAFAGTIMDKDLPMDEEFWGNLVDYAKQGYRIEVKNAKEFSLEACKCNNQH